jgi:hypothetical protein
MLIQKPALDYLQERYCTVGSVSSTVNTVVAEQIKQLVERADKSQ